MDKTPMNRGALASGIFFILAGTVFLLDRLAVLDLRPRYLLPLALIGLGLAIVLGGRAGSDRSS
jgi:hypothetical protein